MGDNMFYKHLIIKNNDEDAIYLFIDFNYEFSFDFDLKTKKEKIQTIYEQAVKYLKDKKINFKAGKIFLVVGGLVIGSLILGNTAYANNLDDIAIQKYQYNEQISLFDNNTKTADIFGKNTSKNIVNDVTADTTVNSPEASQDQVIADNSNIDGTTKEIVSDNQSNVNNGQITTSTPSTKTIQDKPTTSQSQSIQPTAPVSPTTPPVTSTISQPSTVTSAPATTSPTPSTPSAPVTQAPDSTPPPPVQQPAPTPEPTAPVVTEKMVTLYRSNGTVETISLEDYVVGVVGAEMPASFNAEALKAQSVLARTYALKKITNNQVLSDTTSNQVYKDVNQLKAMWGTSFQTYYDKIKNAVASTKDQYLSYNGSYIEAVYHSTSNGQTEDSMAVWGTSYPYLKSVDSHWDLQASSYLRETPEEFSVLSSIIGLDFNAATNVQVLSRTSGNRINQIQIGDKIFTGIELRTLLGLRSADFDIRIDGDTAVFVTRGYGHGVGMSQYGANGMAKEGYGYRDILNHYYPGTQIKS